MRKLILLICLAIATTIAFGAKIKDDSLTVGKPGSSADKIIKLGPNRYIRSNETSGVLEFSNDGALWKKIGSGSGSGGSGGVNILLNSSFEDGLGNWTNSGGTLTQESYTNAVEGDAKFARFVATGAGQYVETDLTTFPDNISGGGMGDFYYTQGDNAFNYEIIDGSAAVIASGSLADLTSWLKAPTVTFPIPAQGKIKIVSTGAGTIDLDKAHLGSNKNIAPLGPQAHFKGSMQMLSAGACTFSNTLSTYAAYSANGSCNFPTYIGDAVDVSAADVNSKVPALKVTGVKKGTVLLMAKGAFRDGSLSNACAFAFYDGSNFSSTNTVYANTPDAQQGNIIGEFHYSSDQGDVRFDIMGKNDGGSAPCDIHVQNAVRDLEISAYFFPDASDTVEAFTPGAAEFYAEGYISGSNLSMNGPFTDSVISSPSISMTAKHGTPLTTCSGAELTGSICTNTSLGIGANLPRAGKYKVCSSFAAHNDGMNNIHLWNISRTGNSDDVIQDEGEQDQVTYTNTTNGVVSNVNLCQVFDIKSPGLNSFELIANKSNSTGTTTIQLLAAANIKPVLKVSIEMIGHYVSKPIIVGKSKHKTKTLANPIALNQVLADLTFNNLTIGNRYLIKFQGFWQNTVADDLFCVALFNTGQTMPRSCGNSYGNADTQTNLSYEFVATNSTLTFETQSINGSLVGNGAVNNTWAQLEEVFNKKTSETSEWD